MKRGRVRFHVALEVFPDGWLGFAVLDQSIRKVLPGYCWAELEEEVEVDWSRYMATFSFLARE